VATTPLRGDLTAFNSIEATIHRICVAHPSPSRCGSPHRWSSSTPCPPGSSSSWATATLPSRQSRRSSLNVSTASTACVSSCHLCRNLIGENPQIASEITTHNRSCWANREESFVHPKN
jgi:hypothetical protein